MDAKKHNTVFLVDDDHQARESLEVLLRSQGFAVRSSDNALDTLEALRREPVDLLLADVNMPGINGLKLVEQLRRFDQDTPVILITGNAELEVALSAIRLKVFEFILKPISPPALLAAVKSGLEFHRRLRSEKDFRSELKRTVVQRTRELAAALQVQKSMSLEVIERLTTAAELRDEDTGQHIRRIGAFAALLAETLGLPADYVETIGPASTMHDIGKIGIPDSVLFKPSPLTSAEFAVIREHTTIGAQILGNADHVLLQMAGEIALSHHECWDGSGYPNGLRGQAIPLSGRIVMLADQYDALRSRRIYKPAYDHATALDIITGGDGKTAPGHFDPAVLAAFLKVADRFDEIFSSNQDGPDAAGPPVAGAGSSPALAT